jgi:hypothetical protein
MSHRKYIYASLVAIFALGAFSCEGVFSPYEEDEPESSTTASLVGRWETTEAGSFDYDGDGWDDSVYSTEVLDLFPDGTVAIYGETRVNGVRFQLAASGTFEDFGDSVRLEVRYGVFDSGPSAVGQSISWRGDYSISGQELSLEAPNGAFGIYRRMNETPIQSGTLNSRKSHPRAQPENGR